MEFQEYSQKVWTEKDYDVQLDFVAGRNAAIAHVTYTDYQTDEVFVGVGEAIKDKTDKEDLDVAYLLAMGRAFSHLGGQLEKIGRGMVKHHDDMREDRTKKKNYFTVDNWKSKHENEYVTFANFCREFGCPCDACLDYDRLAKTQ